MPLNMTKFTTVKQADPLKYTVALSVEGAALSQEAPIYTVFVVDATSSMAERDMANGEESRFVAVGEGLRQYLAGMSQPPYSGWAQHYALVTYGLGGRVHVTAADSVLPPFNQLINPQPPLLAAGGDWQVADHFIGANNSDEAQVAQDNYNSVVDKSLFFYENPQDILNMFNNISRYESTNGEGGLLLAASLLEGIPLPAIKQIIFFSDGEGNGSSTFYAQYHQAEIAAKLWAAEIRREGPGLAVVYQDLVEPITREDKILSGVNLSCDCPHRLTVAQAMELKLRVLSRSAGFVALLQEQLSINPFAGEWHNFDGINRDGTQIRVAAVPNLLNAQDLNGYFWSNGLNGFPANYLYYSMSENFRKEGQYWQFQYGSQCLYPVYTDPVFPQSRVGQCLRQVTFDNSPAERMIFATDQKNPYTRMIDFYQRNSLNIYGSNAAKELMIQAAWSIRQNGIQIRAVGVGGDVLLPEYLSQVDTSSQAYLVSQGVGGAAALAGDLLAFTGRVLTITNDVVINEAVRARLDAARCENDGSFSVDPESFRVAYVHTPFDQPVFQEVDSNTCRRLTLTEEPDQTLIRFDVGALWPADQAGLAEDRYYRVMLSYDIVPNCCVASNNTIGTEDIDPFLFSYATWSSEQGLVRQDFPVTPVYAPPGSHLSTCRPCLCCQRCRRSCNPCTPPCCQGPCHGMPGHWGDQCLLFIVRQQMRPITQLLKSQYSWWEEVLLQMSPDGNEILAKMERNRWVVNAKGRLRTLTIAKEMLQDWLDS